jgi:hypothetical protein
MTRVRQSIARIRSCLYLRPTFTRRHASILSGRSYLSVSGVHEHRYALLRDCH